MKVFNSLLKIAFLVVFILAFFCNCGVKKSILDQAATQTTALNTLSEDFLKAIREDKPTTQFTERLAQMELKEIELGLQTDAERYAFWINIYNAYIQVVLKAKPELYEDRRSFFSEEMLEIAGRKVSFETIEHGILRKSQWNLGLGYVRKWFPGEFERKLRVEKRDFRIHFALNCGAKDCPPVAVYTPGRLEQQLEMGTRKYLERTTRFDESSNTVTVSSLFSWFRGDFGGKSGTRKILSDKGLIPDTKGVSIEYSNYDWTLELDNFIDL
ncbi:Protein of unknown function, DUF547 [Robiginitalea myxolifaciens]|uniref:DUF547 domain-containing protein n=1 Tax=Robiginitalea myxolifaciens TaxID=400055 RepID=A0A1I6H1I0_9FLAO|nr:DUF547 domain-containing protein [Robiginitalea myxolifaciens]SFR48335.1 Protein of unknown function, DUF547 [Robiginitalea myxolifaciens]